MARYCETPITAEDLTEYVANQDDFGLELFVYSKALELGLSATHGGTYIDPVTEKPRQYDVRASAVQITSGRRIDLAIECKCLKPYYPLLISRIPRITDESFNQIIWSYTPEKSPFIVRGLNPSAKTLTIKDRNGLYPLGQPVGKSTTQVGRTAQNEFVTGDADVYDKWTQALGSSAELIQKAAHRNKGALNGSMLTAILPILVVANDTLWVADYSEEGVPNGKPHKTDETVLFVGRDYWQRMGISFTISHLHICTKAGIEALLSKIASDDSYWELLFPQREILYAATKNE